MMIHKSFFKGLIHFAVWNMLTWKIKFCHRCVVFHSFTQSSRSTITDFVFCCLINVSVFEKKCSKKKLKRILRIKLSFVNVVFVLKAELNAKAPSSRMELPTIKTMKIRSFDVNKKENLHPRWRLLSVVLTLLSWIWFSVFIINKTTNSLSKVHANVEVWVFSMLYWSWGNHTKWLHQLLQYHNLSKTAFDENHEQQQKWLKDEIRLKSRVVNDFLSFNASHNLTVPISPTSLSMIQRTWITST